MKNPKYNIGTIVVILLCCVLAVLFFPVASNDKEIYKAVIFASIGVVIILLLFLIKVHVFESGKQNHVVDR